MGLTLGHILLRLELDGGVQQLLSSAVLMMILPAALYSIEYVLTNAEHGSITPMQKHVVLLLDSLRHIAEL